MTHVLQCGITHRDGIHIGVDSPIELRAREHRFVLLRYCLFSELTIDLLGRNEYKPRSLRVYELQVSLGDVCRLCMNGIEWRRSNSRFTPRLVCLCLSVMSTLSQPYFLSPCRRRENDESELITRESNERPKDSGEIASRERW